MTRVLATSQDRPEDDVVEEAARVLLGGGVVVVPTDSVYGIACAATPGNPGHGRIFEIKRRARAQTLPWLIADPLDLDRYAREVPAAARELIRRAWPGQLTLVVSASAEVPENYRAADGTVALRLPDSALVRALAYRCGVPLATTSANTHGRPSATSAAAVEREVAEAADLVIDAGPAPVAVASTVVDFLGGRPRVLRAGPVSVNSTT